MVMENKMALVGLLVVEETKKTTLAELETTTETLVMKEVMVAALVVEEAKATEMLMEEMEMVMVAYPSTLMMPLDRLSSLRTSEPSTTLPPSISLRLFIIPSR